MNVAFIPTTYRPSDEKMVQLMKMQDHIHFTRVEYIYSIRNDSPRNQMLRKQEVHKMFRDRWEVIIGGRGIGPENDL